METCQSNSNDTKWCGTNGFRIVQIHPTLRCNLKCLHCYSSSGPNIKEELDVNKLKLLLTTLWEQGYNTVSISGGEPFMYSAMEELFSFTKEMGFYNMVTTNAMLLKSAKAKRILDLTDLVAISVDGEKEWHNHMRQSTVAFDKMLEGIQVVKDHVPAFGLIHTVTPKSLNSLPWLSKFAVEQGARLLQLHPLEMSGRANDLEAIKLQHQQLLKIYMMSFYLQQEYSEELFIQLDLLHKNIVMTKPSIINKQDNPISTSAKLADVVKNIVIDESGRVLPYAHGFGDFYKIGRLDAKVAYPEMINQFISQRASLLQKLCNHVYDNIMQSKDIDVFNWYELMVKQSALQQVAVQHV